jgi:flavodoxin
MKTAVVYCSKTGHSRKIAHAVAEALQTSAQDIRSAPALDAVDLLFVVGGIYGGTSAPELIQYCRSLDSGKIGPAVLMTSCASRKMKQAQVRQALTEAGVPVCDEEFVCRGSFLFMGIGHPNRADLEQAILFARRIAGY